jgi:polyisoprenoid-binding protein YceI
MKNKKITVLLVLMSIAGSLFAQDKYFTKTGRIEFYSQATVENITAKNKTVTAVLDTKTGGLQFSVPMKGFEFEKALMQQHFNENYIESDKYPKGEFRGTITNNSSIGYGKDGSYPATVKGKMSIHGVTQDVEATGTIKVQDGKLQLNSVFNLQLSDYHISIPAIVKDHISNTVKITVDCILEQVKG